MARGHCATYVILAHNVNHHAEQGRAGDWISPALGGSGHPIVRLMRFIARATRWAHSRNFTGRFTNWDLFNNGYHSAHHLQPALHWSEVPQVHERIADRLPAHLQEHSATRYMVRRYILNRGA